MANVAWHGTSAESGELLAAVEHNCGCQFDDEVGMRVSTCPPHDALVKDQRWLNGLLFMRRQRDRLNAEEGI
jgi:hypothetical protein